MPKSKPDQRLLDIMRIADIRYRLARLNGTGDGTAYLLNHDIHWLLERYEAVLNEETHSCQAIA